MCIRDRLYTQSSRCKCDENGCDQVARQGGRYLIHGARRMLCDYLILNGIRKNKHHCYWSCQAFPEILFVFWLTWWNMHWQMSPKSGRITKLTADCVISTSRSYQVKNLGEGVQTGGVFCWTLHEKIVTKNYPCLTYFKVGALRSRGEESQFDLQDRLHRDYLDDVRKRFWKRHLNQ